MTGPDPLTRQRTPWRDTGPADIGGAKGRSFRRNVHDGFLSALVTMDPHGLHLSVAHHNETHRKSRARRYPTWDEITHARYELTPSDIDMVMILPAAEDYLTVHPTTFHLHQVDNLPNSAVDREVVLP